MTYDLRRLRLHGLIERIPHTHRYRPTPLGWRTAWFYTTPTTASSAPAPPTSPTPPAPPRYAEPSTTSPPDQESPLEQTDKSKT